MAKGIMPEALDKEEYDRMEKGLPPIRKSKVVIPLPKSPVIKGVMLYTDINDDMKKKLTAIGAVRKNYKNEDGVRFVGYEVSLSFNDKSHVTGWMENKDFIMLRHDLFIEGKIDVARILDI